MGQVAAATADQVIVTPGAATLLCQLQHGAQQPVQRYLAPDSRLTGNGHQQLLIDTPACLLFLANQRRLQPARRVCAPFEIDHQEPVT